MEKEMAQYLESKTNSSTTRFGKVQETPSAPLHVFVLGPSRCGKIRLIELFANCNLEIPVFKNIHLAHRLGGFLLQGVKSEINVYHVGDIRPSLELLRFAYQRHMTSFILVYDIADPTTFDDVHHWIPSLRLVLDCHVPIVLVGFEDSSQIQTPGLLPVSFLDGMSVKFKFGLDTFYELSDMSGPAVAELFYEAAHIALERKFEIVEAEPESDDSSQDA